MSSTVSRNLVWLVALVAMTGCAAAAEDDVGSASAELGWWHRARPTPLIFDTDMDFDDASALAYLCQEHKQGRIELLAVTVNNDGAGLPGSAIRHARCILSACGLSHIPVADGSPVGENVPPFELLGAVEAILSGAFASCTESTAPSEISAPELLLGTLRESRRPVTLLTTGPLSNVAAAIALAEDDGCRRPLWTEVDRMVVMGGAVLVPGNVFGIGVDGTQELNIWVDPAAAQLAFETFEWSGVRLIPLDATNDVPATAAFVERLAADRTTAEAEIVYSIVTQPIAQFGISLGLFYWWDPLAAVVATGHREIVDLERARIEVVQEGESQGRTIEAEGGVRMRVGVGADAAAFEDELLDGLNGR